MLSAEQPLVEVGLKGAFDSHGRTQISHRTPGVGEGPLFPPPGVPLGHILGIHQHLRPSKSMDALCGVTSTTTMSDTQPRTSCSQPGTFQGLGRWKITRFTIKEACNIQMKGCPSHCRSNSPHQSLQNQYDRERGSSSRQGIHFAVRVPTDISIACR